nr:MAG TPA: hypothetical protein [Caudoviricetes sp.]
MKDIYTTDAATFERLQAELEETPVRCDIKISNSLEKGKAKLATFVFKKNRELIGQFDQWVPYF